MCHLVTKLCTKLKFCLFPIGENIFYMPQNSYLCYDDVTIRQQIIFPNVEPNFKSDNELKSMLSSNGLSHLLQGIYTY